MIKQPSNIAEMWQSLRNDYNAAKPSKYRRQRLGVQSTGSGADYHYRTEHAFLGMIEQARDMERNDSLIGRIVDSAVTNTVQGGFGIDPQTGDSKIDQLLWQKWMDWSEDSDQCDIAGELTFCEITNLVLRRMFFDGDIFVLPLDSGELQLIEAHRCRTPNNTKLNVVHGIMLNDQRRPLEYWITKDDISPMASLTRVGDMMRYSARDDEGNKQVWHVYRPTRPTQTRGVTALAPIVDVAAMVEDINFAKMVQQQVASCYAIIRERDANFEGIDALPGQGYQATETINGQTKSFSGIGPGQQVFGQIGEKITGFSPNIPNAEFFQQIAMLVRIVSANIGCPPEIGLMDTTQTTFHGYRGAVDEARRGFKDNQRMLMRRFVSPCYEWKVRQWISEDEEVSAAYDEIGEDIFKHKVNAPNWPYIDATKDAQADDMRLSTGLTSGRRWGAERGLDYEELCNERIEDNSYVIRKAKEAAQQLNTEFPDDDLPVTWKDILAPNATAIVQPPEKTVLDEQETPRPAA